MKDPLTKDEKKDKEKYVKGMKKSQKVILRNVMAKMPKQLCTQQQQRWLKKI